MIESLDFRALVKRTGETGDFIRQHLELCVGCGNCVKTCPVGVWQLKKKKAFISTDYQDKCVECGSCWLACSTGAIEFRYPDGGSGIVWEYG